MSDNDASTYIIVYPRGDRGKLCVVEICWGLEHEINDYAIASRRRFFGDRDGARAYARELADKHGLRYEADDYLD